MAYPEWRRPILVKVAGLAVMPDGSLLVTDDTNGVIYQVSYTG